MKRHMGAMTTIQSALCLSGGGYRATLYHLGALRRLNEHRLLSGIDVISAVSGGSLLAGRMAHFVTHGHGWPAAGQTWEGFDTFAADIHAKTAEALPLLGLPTVPLGFNQGRIVMYPLKGVENFVGKMQLAELPARPDIRFLATDLALGEPFMFSRNRIGTPSLGWSEAYADASVAEAVTASACFPPVLKPIPAAMDATRFKGGTNPRAGTHRTLLADGGVLDNRGLSAVSDAQVVLVSDGGRHATTKASLEGHPPPGLEIKAEDWTRQSFVRDGEPFNRMRELRDARLGAQALGRLLDMWENGECDVVVWSIGDGAGGPTAANMPLMYSDATASAVAGMRTNLDNFTKAERGILENQGYLTAEASLRAFAPDMQDADAPLQAPWPEFLPESIARQSLEHSRNQSSGMRAIQNWLAGRPNP